MIMLFRILFIGVVSLTFIGCAQQGGITGGEKDIAPPEIISMVPRNLSTRFNGKSIVVEFDEYVVVENLLSELVVSPPLEYPITYKLKGKRVLFTIEDTLKANTTYNFNFGNAIVDLNEGNILDSNLFVFSTGNYIDSGSIHGIVKDTYTQLPVVDAYVALFPQIADSVAYKGYPLYVAKTDESGVYTLRFLEEKKYQILALGPLNIDYKYTPLNSVGFIDGLADTKDSNNIDISVFNELDTSQVISYEKSKFYYSFNIGFKLNLENPKFEFTPSLNPMGYIIETIETDSIGFWIPGDKSIDTVQVIISDNSGYIDTTRINLSNRKSFLKNLKEEEENA